MSTSIRLAQLHTSRLTLTPIDAGDLDALWPHVSNPELPRHMTWHAHTDRSQTLGFIERTTHEAQAGRSAVWVSRQSGDFRGVIGLHDIERQRLAWRMDKAELGYWVAPPFHGQGFATEAAEAVVRYGFDTLQLHKIEVHSVDANQPSLGVINKLGFRLIGEQRRHFHRDGRWWNLLAYELLRDDWLRRPSG